MQPMQQTILLYAMRLKFWPTASTYFSWSRNNNKLTRATLACAAEVVDKARKFTDSDKLNACLWCEHRDVKKYLAILDICQQCNTVLHKRFRHTSHNSPPILKSLHWQMNAVWKQTPGKEYEIGTNVFHYILNKWQNCNYSKTERWKWCFMFNTIMITLQLNWTIKVMFNSQFNTLVFRYHTIANSCLAQPLNSIPVPPRRLRVWVICVW